MERDEKRKILNCRECKEYQSVINHASSYKKSRSTEPAKPKAPLSATNPARVKLALQNERFQAKQLEKKLKEMQKAIKMSSVAVDKTLEEDI